MLPNEGTYVFCFVFSCFCSPQDNTKLCIFPSCVEMSGWLGQHWGDFQVSFGIQTVDSFLTRLLLLCGKVVWEPHSLAYLIKMCVPFTLQIWEERSVQLGTASSIMAMLMKKLILTVRSQTLLLRLPYIYHFTSDYFMLGKNVLKLALQNKRSELQQSSEALHLHSTWIFRTCMWEGFWPAFSGGHLLSTSLKQRYIFLSQLFQWNNNASGSTGNHIWVHSLHIKIFCPPQVIVITFMICFHHFLDPFLILTWVDSERVERKIGRRFLALMYYPIASSTFLCF